MSTFEVPGYVNADLRRALQAHERWPNATLTRRMVHALCNEDGTLKTDAVGDMYLWLRAEGLAVVPVDQPDRLTDLLR